MLKIRKDNIVDLETFVNYNGSIKFLVTNSEKKGVCFSSFASNDSNLL